MDLSGFCRFCLTEDDAKTPIAEDPDGLVEKINKCLPTKVSDIYIYTYYKIVNYYNFIMNMPYLISFQKQTNSQK